MSVDNWFSPDERSYPTLREDGIHVWRACLDQPTSVVAYLKASLSHDEQIRADRYYFERDSKRFIVCRGILRIILSYYLHTDAIHLQFSYDANGKPLLDAALNKADNLHFNLSHSEGLALYAITRERSIGIDLEKIRQIPDIDSITERFFSSRESADFRSLPTTTKLEAFFNCWTRKEAYLKARGDGLTVDPDQFDVTLIPGEPATLLDVRGDPQEASQWSLNALSPARGYVAAIAVHGHNLQYEFWHWGCQPVS